jgi:hypothetical protein
MSTKQFMAETRKQAAIARKRILALEGKVSGQVGQYVDAWLAEAERPSTVQDETDEELAARRKAAKWKAAKWKADAQRRSGFLGLFSDSLRAAMDHIDALADEAVRSSLMVNLGFLLVASNNAGALASEAAGSGAPTDIAPDLGAVIDELNAFKQRDKDRPAAATLAKKTASAQVDEIILNRAGPYRTDDGWAHGTPKKIQPAVERDIGKLNAERRAACESLPHKKRRFSPIPKLEASAISHRLNRLKRTIVRPS